MSGGAESLSDEEARVVFGDRVAVYIEGSSPGGESSTVVDVTGSEVVVLRRGPVVL
jgi:tRNA A37 threonylcarbamoyladenosine synthetase subunit TsaC/SUA5/YrdC